jgi:hypothetical protein
VPGGQEAEVGEDRRDERLLVGAGEDELGHDGPSLMHVVPEKPRAPACGTLMAVCFLVRQVFRGFPLRISI